MSNEMIGGPCRKCGMQGFFNCCEESLDSIVKSDSSDCSTSTGATVELISAASHYVDLSRKGLTPYIRENGRYGKTSAWAELVQAVDDYQKSGGQ